MLEKVLLRANILVEEKNCSVLMSSTYILYIFYTYRFIYMYTQPYIFHMYTQLYTFFCTEIYLAGAFKLA